MVASELKTNLIQLILDTNNASLLEHFTDYFKAASEKEEWWDLISANQQSFLQRSSAQIQEGKVVAHSKVRAEVNRIFF
jgi:hypothetical protein